MHFSHCPLNFVKQPSFPSLPLPPFLQPLFNNDLFSILLLLTATLMDSLFVASFAALSAI